MGDYWSVTRYEDIMYVDTNPALFSSEPAKSGLNNFCAYGLQGDGDLIYKSQTIGKRYFGFV